MTAATATPYPVTSEPTTIVVALSTAPDETTATTIANALVEARLAACVNLLLGVRSIYRWQASIADDREVLMIIKTRLEHIGALKLAIAEMHPYQVPELLVLSVAAAADAYLQWVLSETARS